MTTQNEAHERLIETVAKDIEFRRYKSARNNATSDAIARAATAILYSALREVTPAMIDAWRYSRGGAEAHFQAMLAVSALAPATPEHGDERK